jgi:hypothetical protein
VQLLSRGGLKDLCLRLSGQGRSVLAGGPHVLLEEAEELFRLADGVEVEVDETYAGLPTGRWMRCCRTPARRRASAKRANAAFQVSKSVMGCSMCNVAIGNSLVRMAGVVVP